MKATAVGKRIKPTEEYKPTEVEGKPCCECGKELKSPWARVESGEKWVCSRTCYDLHKRGVQCLVVTFRK